MSTHWKMYNVALKKRPLETKAITAGILTAISDIIAQRLQKQAGWNAVRTLKMAFLGMMWMGPSVHVWQNIMAKIIFKDAKANSLAVAIKKTIVDQMVYGPTSNVVVMLYLSVVVNGETLAQALMNLKERYWMVQKNGWRFWPIVSFLSYRFVPIPKRALFANFAALLWSIYLNSTSTVTVTQKQA